MADGVDAAVQRHQAPTPKPVTDLPPGRTERAELLARHDATLRRGDATDRAVERIFVASVDFAAADGTNDPVWGLIVTSGGGADGSRHAPHDATDLPSSVPAVRIDTNSAQRLSA